MSSAIIWNIVMAIPFLLAFIAVPIWMSVKHPDHATDHAAALRYLTARRTPIPTATALLNGAGTAGSEREPALAARS